MPLPLPEVPPVSVSQALLLTAVHEQPPATVTATLPAPPAAARDVVVGVIDGAHETPACVTVNVCPAMVAVPVRFVVPVCAAIE
jgi:hypothetical protein